MNDGITKIFKLNFMATDKECKIKKESPMILQETKKTYKIEHSGVINKSKINLLRDSIYRDTHQIFSRTAWATEDQIELITKEFEIKAIEHFKRVAGSAGEAIVNIRKAYHGK